MTEIAVIDWFGRWGTSDFSENTAIFNSFIYMFETMGNTNHKLELFFFIKYNVKRFFYFFLFFIFFHTFQ